MCYLMRSRCCTGPRLAFLQSTESYYVESAKRGPFIIEGTSVLHPQGPNNSLFSSHLEGFSSSITELWYADLQYSSSVFLNDSKKNTGSGNFLSSHENFIVALPEVDHIWDVPTCLNKKIPRSEVPQPDSHGIA